MPQSMIVTPRITRWASTKEALTEARELAAQGEIVAVYDHKEHCLFESHPDECLFCGNLKSFCVCEED